MNIILQGQWKQFESYAAKFVLDASEAIVKMS